MPKTLIGFEAVNRNQVIHDLAILKLSKDSNISTDLSDEELLHKYYEVISDLNNAYNERYSK